MTTNLIQETKTKKVLLRKLLDGIKDCQTRFGSRTELATEDDTSIRKLCSAFEQVFLHGGIKKSSEHPSKGLWQLTENLVPGVFKTTEYSFWSLIKLQLSKHETERFLQLHNVHSDLGRGRAWLRASLNEHSLKKYILVILSIDTLNLFYEDWAFLRDHELSSILPQTAAGLGSILFALRVDNAELDTLECGIERSSDDPIAESMLQLREIADVTLCSNILTSNTTGRQIVRKQKKKKTPTAFVSFDEEETSGSGSALGSETGTVSSTPSTCFNYHIQKELSISDQPKTMQEAILTSKLLTHSATIPSNPIVQCTTTSIMPSIFVTPGCTEDIKSELLSKSNSDATCSISLKSVDCISIYSDCSDRIDNISLNGISPNQRLNPIGSGESDPERTHGLIPVPSYNSEELIDNGTNSNYEGVVFSEITEMNQSDNSVDRNQNYNLSPRSSADSSGVGERLVKLKTILDHEVEVVDFLKVQMAEEKRKYNDETKILEARNEAMTKENEILKHQLKKYIGAVQLLKERRTSLDDDDIGELGVANDERTTEGVEYERKLIQVAEMHGELMEFNSYLQTELQRKDYVIRKLREELVDLRGPTPMVGNYDPDEENITSFSEREQPASRIHRLYNERVLINIWIPSVFLTGATNDLHHVYQVFVRIKDTEWNVYRRYSQFHSLHRDLKKRDLLIGSFYFPPKKHLGNKDSKFVDERRRKLQEYLRKLINHTLQTNPILASHPDKNLLISILPFFGEASVLPKPERDTSRSRGLFFLQSSPTQREVSSNSRVGWLETGSYTGL